MITIKKYGNRRLYDTSRSRYITLEDLVEQIRAGHEVRVVDVKTKADLTQATLAQVILESRRAAGLLPVPLLIQLIRMGDDALAEFFGRILSWALEGYLQMRQGAQVIAPINPFVQLPFFAVNAISRVLNSFLPWQDPTGQRPAGQVVNQDDVQELRQEIEELKQWVKQHGSGSTTT